MTTKLDDNENDAVVPDYKRQKLDTSIHDSLLSFKNVKYLETLNEHTSSKAVFLRCEMRTTNGGVGDKDNSSSAHEEEEENAVVILEKTAFKQNDIENILSGDTLLKKTLQNDIYGTYECQIKPELCGIKATVIHPATEKHVEKYRKKSIYLVQETAQDYVTVTQPHIKDCTQFSLQWVENILEHKKESDRIVFEDPDPENGFILLPDMKWDRERIEDLYLVAICHRRGIRTLRDVVANEHIALLRNIRTKALASIGEKFGVFEHQLRVFVHYQPSYYHFHVHFTHLKGDGSGAGAAIQVERAHLLDTIINNLELVPDYYQKATLTYAVREGEKLYDKFKTAGKFNQSIH